MQINFLGARVPLVKRYTATSKEPYPNAYEFKSYTTEINSLQELFSHMLDHSQEGHCLLKGVLHKPLDYESRAGSTSPTDMTEMLCFDVDGMSSTSTPDEFMAKLGMSDVSYILQWSSSYGINGNWDLNAHIYVLCTSPVSPDFAKLFLKYHNLMTFKDDLELTKTNMALRWGLDVTTCQNDKLLYLADPVCTPPEINQFTGQRFTLVQKVRERCDITQASIPSAAELRALELKTINNLRISANLPERKDTKYRLKEYKGEAYLPDPDQAVVTGVKQERGFVYLNLNGGDSWGYFHPDDNPTFVYNFKGEPTYKTSELVPDYWQQITQARRQTIRQQHKSKLFLAFRDFRTADYFNGWYDQVTDEIVLHPAKSEKQLEHFLVNYGQPVPEAVPIWDVVYSPSEPRLDTVAKRINVFKPSMYMRLADEAKATGSLMPMPTPTIDKVLKHAVGESLYDHVFNWLAYIFQVRKPTRTAWVLHGVQGTGKGILMNYVLAPVFGESNVVQKRTEELEDKFNDYLERKLIVNVDEADIGESGRARVIMANLKNQITEPTISVRRMRQSSNEVPNYTSFIFSSNKRNPVVIESSDRRFNVGEYQAKKLELTDDEFDAIKLELGAFAHRLMAHAVSVSDVRTPMMNEAKKSMQMASKTSADVISDALNTADLSTLWDALPTSAKATLNLPLPMQLVATEYENLMADLVKTRRTKLSRDELYTIYEYNVGKIPITPIKFTTFLKHHDIVVRNMRVYGKQIKGYDVGVWENDEEWFKDRVAELNQREVVTPNKPTVNVIEGDKNVDRQSNTE